MSVMKEPNRATAAMTAEPMATPLVMALVVLPTASRSVMILRALFGHAGHFADAVGVVGDRAEGVHGDHVAGVGQPADADQRHAVDDVLRALAAVDQHRDHDRGGDRQDRPGAGFIAFGQAARMVVAGPKRVLLAISCTGALSVAVK